MKELWVTCFLSFITITHPTWWFYQSFSFIWFALIFLVDSQALRRRSGVRGQFLKPMTMSRWRWQRHPFAILALDMQFNSIKHILSQACQGICLPQIPVAMWLKTFIVRTCEEEVIKKSINNLFCFLFRIFAPRLCFHTPSLSPRILPLKRSLACQPW